LVFVRRFQHGQHSQAEPLGILKGIERVSALLGSRCAEEVCLRTGRQHQAAALTATSVGRLHRKSNVDIWIFLDPGAQIKSMLLEARTAFAT
jgi:hypothetical protein